MCVCFLFVIIGISLFQFFFSLLLQHVSIFPLNFNSQLTLSFCLFFALSSVLAFLISFSPPWTSKLSFLHPISPLHIHTMNSFPRTPIPSFISPFISIILFSPSPILTISFTSKSPLHPIHSSVSPPLLFILYILHAERSTLFLLSNLICCAYLPFSPLPSTPLFCTYTPLPSIYSPLASFPFPLLQSLLISFHVRTVYSFWLDSSNIRWMYCTYFIKTYCHSHKLYPHFHSFYTLDHLAVRMNLFSSHIHVRWGYYSLASLPPPLLSPSTSSLYLHLTHHHPAMSGTRDQWGEWR